MAFVFLFFICSRVTSKKDYKKLTAFAEWLDSFKYKRDENGMWYPMDLPFLYTTKEVVRDFYKDLEDGKIRINE
jgi:hypothetical protein